MVQVVPVAQHSSPPKRSSLLTCDDEEDVTGQSLVDIMRHFQVVETDRTSRSRQTSWGANDIGSILHNQIEADESKDSETRRANLTKETSWARNDIEDIIQMQMLEIEAKHKAAAQNTTDLQKDSSWGIMEIEAILESQLMAEQQAEKQQAEKQQAEKQQAEKQQAEKQQAEKQQAEKQQAEKHAEKQQDEKQHAKKQQDEKQQAEKQQASEAGDDENDVVKCPCPNRFTRESSWGINDISDIIENEVLQEDVKVPKKQIPRIVRPSRSGRGAALIKQSSWARHDISGVLER